MQHVPYDAIPNRKARKPTETVPYDAISRDTAQMLGRRNPRQPCTKQQKSRSMSGFAFKWCAVRDSNPRRTDS